MSQPRIGMVMSCDRYVVPTCSTVVQLFVMLQRMLQKNQRMSHRYSPTDAAYIMKVAVAHILSTVVVAILILHVTQNAV